MRLNSSRQVNFFYKETATKAEEKMLQYVYMSKDNESLKKASMVDKLRSLDVVQSLDV